MTELDIVPALDLYLRGASVGLFLLIGLAALRAARGRPAAWLGGALSLGAAVYCVCSAPDHFLHRPIWLAPLVAICAGNAVVFWLFTRALFDDSFRPRAWHAVLWIALATCPVGAVFGGDFFGSGAIKIVVRIAPVVLVLVALVQTVTGWRGDLVEGRRRLRLFILAAVALHTAVSATVDLSLAPGDVPPMVHLLNAGALAVIAGVIAGLLLQADLDPVLAGRPAPVAVTGPSVGPDESVDPRLLAMLARLMTVDRLYRQEGLTVGALAVRVGLPERRLRHAINRGLGFRNFNEYLNQHRLVDAKQALADPTQAKVSILTIALDAGFQSLGPFNRAFKADTGMTPSEFRRAASANGSA